MFQNIQPGSFRQKRNLVAAYASEILRPVLHVHAALVCGAAASPPSDWRRGLIYAGDSHIGDILYNTPSLPHLARGLPQCEWHYAATKAPGEVLGNNPHLGGLILANHAEDFADSRSDAAAKIRRMKFDVAISYTSGNPAPSLRFMLKNRIANRVGKIHKGFSGWITHPVGFRAGQSFPAYFRDLVSELTGLPPDWPLRPLVYPDAKDESDGLDRFIRIPGERKIPVIAAFLTSRQPHGVWPVEGFCQTLQLVTQQRNVRLVLCGAPDDRVFLEQANQRHSLGASINAGDLGLRALVCFLRQCSLVLCPDSGSRHLANAAGTPVVFVRNLWFKHEEAGTYCDTEFDMAPRDAECVAVPEQAGQLARIKPEHAADHILKLLESVSTN